jgi:hypothetical protein
MNELLRTPSLWDPGSRLTAEVRFDARIVEIFFGGLEASNTDFRALRDQELPMPTAANGYRSVLMLGTTGAGKTTLVRQLTGTDIRSERFPSTSTAKTTVADTEIIFREGPSFSAVVTFVGRDEVFEYLSECMSEAALAVFREADDREIRRKLLDHPNQRFRFSYVLGRGVRGVSDDDVDDEYIDDDPQELELDAEVDLETTTRMIDQAVETLRDLVGDHAALVREEVGDDEADERVLNELIEETLDEHLRTDDRFHETVDALFDEIEKRFDLLAAGDINRNRQGWPVAWTWNTDDRSRFFKVVTRFSSNYAPLFGTLLTPLVNGIRVAGPFSSAWPGQEPLPLVLIDGEGLGHTPTSATALSTSVSKRIEEVDTVLLVDNATQPMQAAPVAAMKAVVTSGNAGKLIFCFTHFDLVKGGNLPTFSDREDHVRASAENVLKAIGDDLGPFAERILRQRLESASFFVGGIDEPLDPKKKLGRRTIDQLSRLLSVVDQIVDRPGATEARPAYDRANLVLAIREAALTFHQTWRARLGLDVAPGGAKEHWTRIKALSRRLAEGWADEYDKLKPVAELKKELEEQIYRMLQQPIRWEGDPDEDEKQQIVDDFANSIAKELQQLSERRINFDRVAMWRDAYGQSGRGSTFIRADIIDGIYERGAPVPSVTPSPDRNSFLHEVTRAVDRVSDSMGIRLL